MCGICGVIQVGGEPREVIPRPTLDWMTDTMRHRGPNDRGTYAAPGVALGVRRLSVVDVEGGHQPFANESGQIWAIQNGEIYNHAALRDTLVSEGHRFGSRCDTEVLPHLYERYGPAFQEHLRGMYGLAVWDGGRRHAVLARDRLGIKPLYYARSGDLLVFASELKSLLASGIVEPELDYEAIDAYLSLGFVPGPRTPLAGVSKLSPGHRLVVEDGAVRVESYWRYPEPSPSARRPIGEAAAELLEELEESVRLRLMSDVPLGAMLSGGLDSSLIVALMARNMTEPVKTFSVGFRGAGDGNELADAREVAQRLGAEHHELELSLSEHAVDLDELVWCLDEPLADLSALGFLALSRLAAQHVTVALSGQGADELLGGYLKHRAAAICGAWQRVPGPVRTAGAKLAPLAGGRFARAARTIAAPDPAARLVAMSGKLDEDLRRRLVRGPLAELDGCAPERAVRALLRDVPDDPLPVTLFLDGQLALVDDMLHYFDRASMAHSLEVRVPFLDHRVVEYCATVPGRLKVDRRLNTKVVLKQAARGLVPDRIVDKPKIGFFRDSVDSWLAAQSRGAISDYLLGSNPAYPALLDRETVEQLAVQGSAPAQPGSQHLLLSILILEIWLSSFLPRALAPAPATREQVRLAP